MKIEKQTKKLPASGAPTCSVIADRMENSRAPYNKWQDIEWAACPRCDTSPIKALVMREMPAGMVYDGDDAICPSCGLEGEFNEDSRDDTIFVYWDLLPNSQNTNRREDGTTEL